MSAIKLAPRPLFGAWGNHLLNDDLRKIRELFDNACKNRPMRERYRAHYWEAYSPKLDRRVGLYRDVGQDHWVWMESDFNVSWFTEAPSRIWMQVGRRLHSRPFDMVVERSGDIECHRFVDETVEPTNADLEILQAELEWCESQRFCYRPFSRSDIERHRVSIENWKRMLSYLRSPRHVLEDRVFGYVSGPGELTLAELDLLLADVEHTVARAAVYTLLRRGVLVAPDLAHQPLSSRLTVRLPHES